MTPHAANRLAKADSFLKQMMAVPIDAAPAASIHLAYYAMLHAAAAVLLDRGGEVPKTHAGTIGQFSYLVQDTEAGRAFGRALSKAEKLRPMSDYDDQAAPAGEDASNLRTMATDFVAYCHTLL